MTVAACLLGAACVTWSAVPLPRADAAVLALLVAAACAAAGMARLALARVPRPEDDITLPQRTWDRSLSVLRQPPWEEGAAVAMLWLEAMHPARPWHTAVLGAALTAYLLAVHLAETAAPPRVLRPQARALTAGAVLLALGAGVAMIPAAGPGGAAGWLGVLAAAAAIAAAVLTVPL